ncbi:MoaD/ThiS family protein [Flavobacteriales bacterium]|jgi:molybdopterin synthase sulfur carrier subunit|nr:MoaD/ThiS family protein [Flavobacteriales bacterium]MDB2621842.1 MoaD/ThiS family protein [Flavobacteriales bacterium]
MALIRYFGQIAEATGCTREKVCIANINLKDLMDRLNEQYGLERFQKQIAVNQVLVNPNKTYLIKDSDEIVILPPYAGG